jgi:hypothetical protein
LKVIYTLKSSCTSSSESHFPTPPISCEAYIPSSIGEFI